MNEAFEKYVQNIEALSDAMSIEVPAGADRSEIIAIIQKNAYKTYALHEENDRILRDFLFSKKPETLTAGEVEEISKFAQKLAVCDKPIAYLCYKLLHDYAVLQNDKDLLINTCYWLGNTIFYLRYDNTDLDVFLFLDKVAEHLGEGAEYFKDYESFEKPETRKMLLMCYVERRTVSEYFNLIGSKTDLTKDRCRNFDYFLNRRKIGEQTLALAYDEKYRSDDATGIPWDRYIDISHLNNTLFTIDMLRDSWLKREEYDIVAESCLQGQTYICDKASENAKDNQAPISLMFRFRFAIAKYHAGLIHANDLIGALLELYNECPRDDISVDGYFTNMELPTFILKYREFLDEEGKRKYGAAVDRVIDGIYDYLKLLPRGRNINEMNDYLTDIVLAIAKSGGNRSRQILGFTLACHPPTYIHSLMVAEICRNLFLRIAETEPESLRGILGIEYAPAIRESRDKIAKRVYLCGLYHDIGKCMIIEHVGNYTRRLTDEEFAIIKLHPLLGYRVLTIFGSHEIEAFAALNHHRSYDRKGGYPIDAGAIPRKAEAIVDILTVADCLDAGTDNIGRCYAASKSVDTLIEELKKGSGTRYAPYVVRVFEDADFCKKIKRDINRSRRRIYAKIYSELAERK